MEKRGDEIIVNKKAVVIVNLKLKQLTERARNNG